MVTDTRKRNTILTLVAWLKRVLQTSTNDNAETQLFALSEMLPTELLLTKLMPQLSNASSAESTQDVRSSASSKRFSRQRNNRFNTVGVSKEELADARLYLQKKLLTDNLATTATQTASTEQQTILDDSEDSRRKSLNLSYANDLDKDIRSIFRESKNSFSKSIDLDASPEDARNAFPVHIDQNNSFATTNYRTESTQSKMSFRRKSNPYNQDALTDSDDDQPINGHKPNGSTPNKSMNKFALRKLKMKRANTIDIPKEQLPDLMADQGLSDDNSHTNNVDKNHLPEFKVKSSSDKKFLAFLNKNADENHSSWVNPNKTTLPVQQKANNWTNKFGNIKNSFEQHEVQLPVSPRMNKKNNFTHAPTSPFKPVQSSKPPLIPIGVHHYQNNVQNVHHKVAAIQAHDKPNSLAKPQLRTHQSVPSYDNNSPMYRDANVHMKSNNWQQSKYSSVDSFMQKPVSPNLPQGSYNPLYVPLNKQPSHSPSNPVTPVSNPVTPSEFPAYTYTSTDYTLPSCVSTFGPENNPAFESMLSPERGPLTNGKPANEKSPFGSDKGYFTPEKGSLQPEKGTSPIIKNTILPDTSYLKSTSPAKSMPPLLGSSRLNRQMKTIDVYSSNEYLSEPNNYYRSPQPFSPTNEYNYPASHDSRRSSQEFTATSQIMRYPQSQTATVINKAQHRYDDEQQAQNLRTFLTSATRNEKRQSGYSELSISPFSESNFSHFNQTYVPPEPVKPKPNSNFVSMENISSNKFNAPEQGAPIRLRNNTSHYGSHHALSSNQIAANNTAKFSSAAVNSKAINESSFIQNKFDPKVDPSKISSPMRLNNYGGQYIQPKIESNLDFSKPTYGKKPGNEQFTQGNAINNNVSNLNRTKSITHQRVSNYEVKRKQSLPAQNSDYFEAGFNEYQQNQQATHNSSYLPFGALKKSKSTHTLALLQQFEAKTKHEEPPLPSYVKRPSLGEPKVINDTKAFVESRAFAETKSFEKPIAEIKPKPIMKKAPRLDEPKVEAKPQSAPISQPIRPKSPPKATAPIRSNESKQKLEPPAITETPSSPLVEDGHIIFPGQTTDTKRRVQHYAQTLNAMLNRKSVIVDDDADETVESNDTSKGPLQRSKSGTLLAVPKQYESAIKRSEVLQKERTVAAYFAGSKSPQGLQRSSSQHSVLSSSSVKTVEERKSNTVSPMHSSDSKTPELREVNSTTTTKSAHHLKILRKQQKQITSNPLAKSQTLPSINLLDESNVDDAFDDLFASFSGK